MVDPSINEHGQRFDRLQLVALLGLMIVGALFVCSATHANPLFENLPWYDQMWVRQASSGTLWALAWVRRSCVMWIIM